ncbi:unnamed protein product [Wuchereria bancrofti]|uniref:Uncharacterized protein n=1 Tax=Wuchereria bancrofti TaxID=6293 RepID=A0A3P7EL12_WUCBA|nr:unnamed protein product [Wuchereria bancrofti]
MIGCIDYYAANAKEAIITLEIYSEDYEEDIGKGSIFLLGLTTLISCRRIEFTIWYQYSTSSQKSVL